MQINPINAVSYFKASVWLSYSPDFYYDFSQEMSETEISIIDSERSDKLWQDAFFNSLLNTIFDLELLSTVRIMSVILCLLDSID